MKIDPFVMKKRVVSRLEKYVFDRVWNDPYTEYRTNTRPRILNQMIQVYAGTDLNGNELTKPMYTPSAGVLSGAFEQIPLPSSDNYYVYSVERNQFRPIKLASTSWITLEEYCNKHLTEIRLVSDGGVSLWRGGIYIQQDSTATSILVAVDADMLHRCLDVYTKNNEGKSVLSVQADPTQLFFIKYFDSDLKEVDTTIAYQTKKDGKVQTAAGPTIKRINDPDNKIECTEIDNAAYINIVRSGKDPVTKGATVSFYNGRVLSGSYLQHFVPDSYVESFTDEDVIYNGVIDRSSDSAPIYTTQNGSRMLFHVPKAYNPQNYLITYNTCDFYLIPKSLTEAKINGGYDVTNAGVMVHLCDREEYLFQITHNDFAIDMALLDGVAESNGFAEGQYYVHFLVRTHLKKMGLVRDANYCDLLYSYSHSDQDIIDFLIDRSNKHDYNMTFWRAAYLEENSVYGRAMTNRVGSTISVPTPTNLEEMLKYGYFRPTIDKYYKTGKKYYEKTIEGQYVEQPIIPDSPIEEGVVEYVMSSLNYSEITHAANADTHTTDTDRCDMEYMKHHGIKITVDNQCSKCCIADSCTLKPATSGFTKYLCPNFSYRSIQDYIKIFGYYNTLSLICKRVTTYRVTSDERKRLKNFLMSGVVSLEDTHPRTGEPLEESTPEYKDETKRFPVHIPLALYDLEADEWYPMVYVNGVKVSDDFVSITGYSNNVDPVGIEEVHWTYTPAFDDEIFWETDQRRLEVWITDPDIEIKVGDYVAIELIPKPKDEEVSVVDIARSTFDISPTVDDVTNGKMAFEPLGSNLKMTDGSALVRKNSELIFLNGKQLVNGIDYMPFETYTAADFKPIVQNVGYLEVEDNLLEAVLTTDKIIGSAKGFVVGNEIEWDGISPFWFDNLSILSVGGKVVSNFEYKYSGLFLADDEHDNGEPYMVRTSVPKSVLDMIYDPTDETADKAKMVKIRDYFDTVVEHRPYRALIPYSHKVYSTYLLAIIKDYLDGKIDFELLLDKTAFKSQSVFAPYEKYKTYDVVYSSLTANDIKFVDIYPIYHNLLIGARTWKKKIAYLMEMMQPDDHVRHREHVNDK